MGDIFTPEGAQFTALAMLLGVLVISIAAIHSHIKKLGNPRDFKKDISFFRWNAALVGSQIGCAIILFANAYLVWPNVIATVVQVIISFMVINDTRIDWQELEKAYYETKYRRY